MQLVLQTLAATGLDANRLELEVTESLLLENTDKVLTALGDCGTWACALPWMTSELPYSSLGSLRNFPFDKIKIDKSFVHGLGTAIMRSPLSKPWRALPRGWTW